MILTLRTDKPEAEIGLYDGHTQRAYYTWEAHRQLSEQIFVKLEELLRQAHLNWSDISGIVCFKGPGSFTGLRIGVSVGNALADSLSCPIVASLGDDWIVEGIGRLEAGENETIALPQYGRDARITKPRK